MALNTPLTLHFLLLLPLLLFLIPIPAQVSAGGIFEIRVEKFQLDENFPAFKCCPHDDDKNSERSFTACLAKCHFLIGVCLDKYEPVWNADRQPECILGRKIVPLPLTQLKKPLANITFPVSTAWQENFTLILDILHDVGDAEPPTLLFRLPSNEINFTAQHNWKVKSFGSRAVPGYAKSSTESTPTRRGIGLSVLTTFNFKCAPGFFGPFCNNTCDLGLNQLECDFEEPQCPEGYEGQHCDIHVTKAGLERTAVHAKFTPAASTECVLSIRRRIRPSRSLVPVRKDGVECSVILSKRRGALTSKCRTDLQFCQNNKGVCKNSGKCENVRSPNGQPYRCVCPPGFRGDHCEMMQLDCVVHGCRNGGQCTQHMDGQSRCLCPRGYYGNLCEFNQTVCSENPCQAPNSVCHPLQKPKNGRQFFCSCPPGFTGENCEINIDDCASKPCQNGAFCEDLISSYRCICPAGLFGIWCENREVECPPGKCPKGSSCYKMKDGSFKCSSPNLNAAHKQNNSNLSENSSPLTSSEALASEKGSIVMVHLQPSFLGLTIGIPVAVALSGLVLAVAVCLFMAACLWRREKKQSQKKPPSAQSFSPKLQPEEDLNGYVSETSTIWSAYEPLNPAGSKDSTLPKPSLYPKYKSIEGKLKTTEPSVYQQQRYYEAPSGRPFSTQVSSTPTYETPGCFDETIGPKLPPRPSRFGPLIAYPPTFLRPILYPFSPQAMYTGRQFVNTSSDLANSSYSGDIKRPKDTIVYAILKPGDVAQGLYPTVPLKKQPPTGESRYKELPQLTMVDAKHTNGLRTKRHTSSNDRRDSEASVSRQI
ncbi:hypothetical protein Aperf_G00000015228 [Anoplocephala perfoliata]